MANKEIIMPGPFKKIVGYSRGEQYLYAVIPITYDFNFSKENKDQCDNFVDNIWPRCIVNSYYDPIPNISQSGTLQSIGKPIVDNKPNHYAELIENFEPGDVIQGSFIPENEGGIYTSEYTSGPDGPFTSFIPKIVSTDAMAECDKGIYVHYNLQKYAGIFNDATFDSAEQFKDENAEPTNVLMGCNLYFLKKGNDQIITTPVPKDDTLKGLEVFTNYDNQKSIQAPISDGQFGLDVDRTYSDMNLGMFIKEEDFPIKTVDIFEQLISGMPINLSVLYGIFDGNLDGLRFTGSPKVKNKKKQSLAVTFELWGSTRAEEFETFHTQSEAKYPEKEEKYLLPYDFQFGSWVEKDKYEKICEHSFKLDNTYKFTIEEEERVEDFRYKITTDYTYEVINSAIKCSEDEEGRLVYDPEIQIGLVVFMRPVSRVRKREKIKNNG